VDDILRLDGVIRNVRYDPHTQSGKLKIYSQQDFDIHRAKTTGIIQFDDETSIGYARWTAPKRTRTGAMPRTYNVYHLPKKAVIIPIIKDEGYHTNNDRINYITFSWMNLSNVHIIMAWYQRASKHPSKPGRITRQKLNADFINERIEELRTYQQTALHWNTMHFERDFEQVYRHAVRSYADIAEQTGAKLVSPEVHLGVLENYLDNGRFSLDRFRQDSLPRSFAAAQRETQTDHLLEYLQETSKAYFFITNWLGGEYHLTTDEILVEGDTVIIQESKNTTRGKIPSLADIQSGLFKLILFANMESLMLNGREVSFKVRLKLTGNVDGKLTLPAEDETIQAYIAHNALTPAQQKRIHQLHAEAVANPRLEIELNSHA